jgi:predicted dehydrogenase
VTTDQVNFVIVGACGEQADESLIPALLRLARTRPVNISALVDLNVGRARQMADRLSISNVFSSQQEMHDSGIPVNAVVIATPHAFHVEGGLMALQHGCHAFIEKPMGTNSDGARLLLSEADSRRLIVMVDYQYLRQMRNALQALEVGLIGPDRYLVSGGFELTGLPSRKVFWNTPESGGVRLDYLGHLTAVALAALGPLATPIGVSAQGWNNAGVLVVGDEFRTVNKVSATVICDENRRAELVVAWLARRRRLGIEVESGRGSLEIPMMAEELDAHAFAPTLHRRQSDGSFAEAEHLDWLLPTPTEACFDLQLGDFIDAIAGRPLQWPFTPQFALRVTEVLDATMDSMSIRGTTAPVRRSASGL